MSTLANMHLFKRALLALGISLATQSSFATTVNASGNNTSFTSALNLNQFFSTTIGGSPSMQNVSVNRTAQGGVDYYRFTISQANTRAIFDIDSAAKSSYLSGFDSYIELYSLNRTKLAANDDSSGDIGSFGSTNYTRDSFLEYQFGSAGDYFLSVSRTQLAAIPQGKTYTLNVSVAPVPEPETYALMGMGLVGLFAARRRKLAKV